MGETDRQKHVGCRVTPVLLNDPPTSVVLRNVWRVKKTPLGSPGNTRPDYQQLLTNVELTIWLDSTEEMNTNLEDRVLRVFDNPRLLTRFGGLSLGESTHLVDEVSLLEKIPSRLNDRTGRAFLIAERGRLSLPVWVDHVGSSGTQYATGNLVERPAIQPPEIDLMPQIPLLS